MSGGITQMHGVSIDQISLRDLQNATVTRKEGRYEIKVGEKLTLNEKEFQEVIAAEIDFYSKQADAWTKLEGQKKALMGACDKLDKVASEWNVDDVHNEVSQLKERITQARVKPQTETKADPLIKATTEARSSMPSSKGSYRLTSLISGIFTRLFSLFSATKLGTPSANVTVRQQPNTVAKETKETPKTATGRRNDPEWTGTPEGAAKLEQDYPTQLSGKKALSKAESPRDPPAWPDSTTKPEPPKKASRQNDPKWPGTR